MASRQRQPEGPPAVPVVQRVRLRYTKRGRMRFTSTRDFQRALERAVRRSGVPIAFSAGFHPHPRISYANAAPTGVASEAEYVELLLAQACDVEQVRAVLDAALPEGIDLVEAVESPGGSMADRLEASVWELRCAGVAPVVLAAAATRLWAAQVAEVRRATKTGVKAVDVRGALLRLTVSDAAVRVATADVATAGAPGDTVDDARPGRERCAILTAVVRHTTPAVRPDDIVTALRDGGLVLPVPALATRLAQGPLDETGIAVDNPLVAAGTEVVGT